MEHSEETIETVLGPAVLERFDGAAHHARLPAITVGSRRVGLAISQMLRTPDAANPEASRAMVRRLATEARAFIALLDTALPAAHAEMSRLGWPADLSFSEVEFHYSAKGEPCIVLVSEEPRYPFLVAPDGSARSLFSNRDIPLEAEGLRALRLLPSLPPLHHWHFGPIPRDTLIDLRPQRIGWRRVPASLYLPIAETPKFEPAELDPFVPLLKGARKRLPQFCEALAPLRHDWAADWSHPETAELAGPFFKAFPEAREAGDIPHIRFTRALRLDRVMLCPRSDPGNPHATWDFRALPAEADHTVFVVRTAPDGAVIEVTTES